jgi:NIPSNAP
VIIELREYIAVPGRFADLVELFTEHTAPAFLRNEMELIDVGKTSVGPDSLNELVYALRFRSIAEMDEKWARFFADEQWLAGSARLEAQGPLLQTIRRRVLDTTSFDETRERTLGPLPAQADVS